MPPRDRQPAQGLSRVPKRMQRQTVSPRIRPRKRPTSPNTSCGLLRCSSQPLARRCDSPSPPLTTSSCRSLTSEAPSPRLPLPSVCRTLQSLRWYPPYSASFSKMILVGRDIASLLSLLFLLAVSLTGRFLVLHSAFARQRAFGGNLSSILLRMNAQVAP